MAESKGFSPWVWATDFSQRETYPHCSWWLRIVNNVTSKRVTCTPARHHKLEEKHGCYRGGLDWTLVHGQLGKQAGRGKRQREPGQTKHALNRSLASGVLEATNTHTIYMNCILTNLSTSWGDSFKIVKGQNPGYGLPRYQILPMSTTHGYSCTFSAWLRVWVFWTFQLLPISR